MHARRMRRSIPSAYSTDVDRRNVAAHVMDSSGAFDPKRLMTYGSPEKTPMRKSTDLDSPAALEEVAPRGVSTCSDTPIVILRRGYAGNDATCEDPAISNDDAEPWAQHALAANGFGDVATTDTDSSARPTIYELHQAARAIARSPSARSSSG